MSITRDDTLNWAKAVASVIGENSTYLTQLDAAIGDADHGANMDRGFKAVMNKMPEISDKDIGDIDFLEGNLFASRRVGLCHATGSGY